MIIMHTNADSPVKELTGLKSKWWDEYDAVFKWKDMNTGKIHQRNLTYYLWPVDRLIVFRYPDTKYETVMVPTFDIREFNTPLAHHIVRAIEAGENNQQYLSHVHVAQFRGHSKYGIVTYKEKCEIATDFSHEPLMTKVKKRAKSEEVQKIEQIIQNSEQIIHFSNHFIETIKDEGTYTYNYTHVLEKSIFELAKE